LDEGRQQESRSVKKRIEPACEPHDSEKGKESLDKTSKDELPQAGAGWKSSRRRRAGKLCLILGLILVFAAAGLTLYNILDGARAEKESAQIAKKLTDDLPDELDEPDDARNTLQQMSGAVPDMPTKWIDGYEYIGTLEINSLNLTLPVMADWDYTRLRISPCRYAGSYLTDDLVICGHNYARHFSPIKEIAIGAEVDFITVDGVRYSYIVANRETLMPTFVAQMIENDKNSGSTSDWDLTLFTCNPMGQTRCAVRCSRKN